MASYGFRLFRLVVTRVRKTEELQFDDPALGAEGLIGLIADAVGTSLSQGETQDRDSSYFRLDTARRGGWVLAVCASGGGYGEPRAVVDITTHKPRRGIAFDDAVLSEMIMLLVVPPYGTSGVVVSEVRGRSHLTPGLINKLNLKLKDQGFVLRLEANVADSVAWNQYLDGGGADVTAIELVQLHPASDRTRFGSKPLVRKASLVLNLTDNDSAKKSLLGKLKAAIAGGNHIDLAGLMGVSVASDDDFDEQRIVYVHNGQARRIKIESNWPVFTHPLQDETAKPDMSTLLTDTREDVTGLLKELNVDRSLDWWPNQAALIDI